MKIEVKYAAPGVYELLLTCEDAEDEIFATTYGETELVDSIRVPLYQSEVGALGEAAEQATMGR